MALLEVGADDFDHVLGGFGGGFRFARHVMEDVVLHEFAHEAVDGSTGSGEALQDIGAVGIFLESVEHGFQLANNFLGAGDEIETFAT